MILVSSQAISVAISAMGLTESTMKYSYDVQIVFKSMQQLNLPILGGWHILQQIMICDCVHEYMYTHTGTTIHITPYICE